MMVSKLKIWIKAVDGLYYQCSEKKGAGQLHNYSNALFSHIQKAGFLMMQF